LLAAVLVTAGLAAWWLHRPPANPRDLVRKSWAQRGVEKPNVLLITLDTTRADHLGAYGYREGETPNIDALAGRGVLFAQATAAAPLTLPAHSSIMTGTYPTYHGVRVNGNTALSPAQTTIAETLKERGYATGAWVAAFVLDGRWGLNQGFDVYDDRFDLGKYKHLDLGSVQRPGNEVVDAALGWLDAHDKGPFFAWVHLYDPHTPYEPPEPFLSKYQPRGMRGLYDGEIAFADQQVGRCLSWLRSHGVEDRTIVVVMGDHGEALGDHGEASHGYFVYDDTLHVPFILSAPLDRLRGVRVDAQVSSVDLLPTLFELLGIAVPARAHGRSLLPVMLDPAGARAAFAYGESMTPNLQFGWSSLHTLRSTRYKLIKAPRPELYDLSADPGEMTNVIARLPAVAEEMGQRLDRLMTETGKEAPEPQAADLDKETRERLAALGYVGEPVATRSSDTSQPLADPKDKLQVFAGVQQAGELILEEKYQEAAQALESALREEPRMPQALLMLGGAYTELGRMREAREQYDRVLKDDPKSVQALVGVASLLMREGKTDDVVTLCKRTLSLDERNTQAYVLLGEVYTGRRQPREALPHFRKAVEIQPKLTQNRLNLAGALIEVEQYDEAESLLTKIVAEYPHFPLAQYNLGLLYEAKGRPAEARAAYTAEVASHPQHYKARFNLGKLLWKLGDRQGSMVEMREVMRIAPRQPEGYLFLARGLLQEPAAIDEVQRLVEKGLSLAQTPDLKALGWMLMADVFNRRRQPERMNEALRKAESYVPAARNTWR
jgi:arylsulfatase A-like enzyme/tetratricopeptide (TPR) repeat protein